MRSKTDTVVTVVVLNKFADVSICEFVFDHTIGVFQNFLTGKCS